MGLNTIYIDDKSINTPLFEILYFGENSGLRGTWLKEIGLDDIYIDDKSFNTPLSHFSILVKIHGYLVHDWKR